MIKGKLAVDKSKVKHCLVCGVSYKEYKKYNNGCWKRDRHIWSKL